MYRFQEIELGTGHVSREIFIATKPSAFLLADLTPDAEVCGKLMKDGHFERRATGWTLEKIIPLFP